MPNGWQYYFVQYEIDGVIYTFFVYSNEQVTDKEGNIICSSGGQPCLEDWILN